MGLCLSISSGRWKRKKIDEQQKQQEAKGEDVPFPEEEFVVKEVLSFSAVPQVERAAAAAAAAAAEVVAVEEEEKVEVSETVSAVSTTIKEEVENSETMSAASTTTTAKKTEEEDKEYHHQTVKSKDMPQRKKQLRSISGDGRRVERRGLPEKRERGSSPQPQRLASTRAQQGNGCRRGQGVRPVGPATRRSGVGRAVDAGGPSSTKATPRKDLVESESVTVTSKPQQHSNNNITTTLPPPHSTHKTEEESESLDNPHVSMECFIFL